MIEAPRWTKEQLQQGLDIAINLFREERLLESIEEYTVVFDKYQGTVEDLLETSVDLSQLDETLISVLTNPALLEAFRYIAGPPISKDDLMVVAKAQLSPTRLKEDPEMAARVLEVVRAALDQRRFPWVIDEREPTPSEKQAAVIASAALLATSRVATNRRSVGKEKQELTVQEALLKRGLHQVSTRSVLTSLHSAPKEGEFCRESMFGSSKADFLVGLWDRRIMAIECKVSNSSTNSVKRLNREAAGKAEKWLHEFGALNVVPVAVLSGVYKISNLSSAQSRGLTLYWAHDLDQLLDFIEAGRPK